MIEKFGAVSSRISRIRLDVFETNWEKVKIKSASSINGRELTLIYAC